MTQRWRRADAILSRRLPDGVLVMSLTGGDPTAISGPGQDLWEFLATPATTDQIVHALALRYGLKPAAVRGDIEPILDRLEYLGLIENDAPR